VNPDPFRRKDNWGKKAPVINLMNFEFDFGAPVNKLGVKIDPD